MNSLHIKGINGINKTNDYHFWWFIVDGWIVRSYAYYSFWAFEIKYHLIKRVQIIMDPQISNIYEFVAMETLPKNLLLWNDFPSF